MATFNDLVRAIAEVEGMDPMTVRGVGIKVREAGMISKSGRGLSAARMTVEDAAALLIGVNGTAMAKNAAETVQAFRDLRLTRDGTVSPDLSEWAESRDASDPVQRAFRFNTPFGETLATLISAFVPRTNGSTYFDPDTSVVVAFERPVRSAYIGIYWEPNHEDDSPDYWTAANFESSSADHPSPDGPDRSDSTRIGVRTLRAVGQVLAT